jgi:ABC-type nitrate/sulfonate/bicarbonate transport system permease component
MAWSKSTRVAISLGVPLLVWVLVSASRLVDPIILPSPWSVAGALPAMFRERLLRDVGLSVGRVLAALVIASLAGVPLGLLLGYRRNLYELVEGPLHALRSLPGSALFPLFLLLLGVGETSIVALATYPSLLVILVNAVTGAALANKRRLYQARLLGLGTMAIVSEVLFYEALPNIFNGVRTAVSYSLLLVIAVEMFIGLGEEGLGRAIYQYQATYRIPETYAAIIIAGLIGILLNGMVTAMEHRMLRWVPHAHEETA